MNASRCDYCGSIVVIQTDHPRLDPRLLNKAVVDEHIAKFRMAVRRDPNDETAHYGLGVAYFNLGLLDESADELAQAARLMPENPHIQTQLAVVYADLARARKPNAEDLAWDRLNRALLLRPDFGEALRLKADLHLRKQEWKWAVATWRQATERDADLVRASIAKFLSDHEHILLASPKFSGAAARQEHVRAAQARRTRLLRYGLFALLAWGVLVFDTWHLGAWPSVLLLVAAIAAMIAVLLYVDNRRRKEEMSHVPGWDRLDANTRALLTGATRDTDRLLDAAEYVAVNLMSQSHSGERLPAIVIDRASDGGTPPRSTETWEYCEIVTDSAFLKGLSFAAEVVGPGGRRRIDEHVVGGQFPPKRSTDRYVRKMVDRLVSQGWEPHGKGQEWWSYRFRRPSA